MPQTITLFYYQGTCYCLSHCCSNNSCIQTLSQFLPTVFTVAISPCNAAHSASVTAECKQSNVTGYLAPKHARPHFPRTIPSEYCRTYTPTSLVGSDFNLVGGCLPCLYYAYAPVPQDQYETKLASRPVDGVNPLFIQAEATQKGLKIPSPEIRECK